MSLAVSARRLLLFASVWVVTVPVAAPLVRSQSLPHPQREQLLNGLPLYLWPRPSDQDVLLKLRIHSGAVFDLAGKSGEMGLLADILFPDPATREYFTEQMGKLTVNTDYDAITITMQGKATEFERIVEILRNALVAPQLTPEVVSSVRDGRIKIVKETSISPATIADRAIAARLFGDYPYGQPHTGSAESLGRIDRADLMLARERFLNPNNATLTVIGGVQRARVLRTLRQLLGSWRKSEQTVPATFRQPQRADSRTLIINAPSDESVELRLATRGLSRSDKDAMAATVLASIMRERWKRLVPELARNPVFVRHEARLLPGIFVMGAAVKNDVAQKVLRSAKEIMKNVISNPVSAVELEQAKEEAVIALNKSLSSSEGTAEAWLDVETYKLPPPEDQLRALQRISVADVQRVAASLFGKAAFASVVVGNAEQLRAELQQATPIEVLGEVKPESKSTSETATPKPSITNKPD
jgi:predicted Zn-dependent peptidase